MTKAFDCALRLLSRREHSRFELATKLSQRGFCKTEVNDVIIECQRLGLQSDERFVESFCSHRIRQGYGPLRIREELKSKQIASELIDEALCQEEDNWVSHANTVWLKKYGQQDDIPFNELLKQQRFMSYRGFPSDVIAKVFCVVRRKKTVPF